MSGEQNFRVNVKDFLGIENTKYREKMMQVALTKPADFYELREKVRSNVIEKAIGDFYDTLYYVMTTGKLSNGGQSAAKDAAKASEFTPNIPKQKVNDFALSAVKTLESIVEDAVDMMLPPDFLDIAKSRTISKSSAANID